MSAATERNTRRLADRKGYLLRKDRRSENARYYIIHALRNFHVGVNGDTFTLDEAHVWLAERDNTQTKRSA